MLPNRPSLKKGSRNRVADRMRGITYSLTRAGSGRGIIVPPPSGSASTPRGYQYTKAPVERNSVKRHIVYNQSLLYKDQPSLLSATSLLSARTLQQTNQIAHLALSTCMIVILEIIRTQSISQAVDMQCALPTPRFSLNLLRQSF